MIVSREYIPFRTLIEKYDQGGELFIKLSKKAYPAYMWEQCFLQLSDFSLYQREMAWAFRGIQDLIEGFQKLDQEDPYETGYDLQDARTADILWENKNTLMLLLRTGEERGREIVGVIEVTTTQNLLSNAASFSNAL